MEKSVEFEIADYIKEVLEMKEVEPEGYSPLTLAYIGDSIYDLIIKTKVISEGNKQVKKLHRDKQYGAGVCPVRDDACPSAIAY